jgi:hypothetical protein
MADYFPLIVNPVDSTINELPAGDNLTLANSNIVNAGNISANFFIGDGSQLTNIPIGTSLSNGNSSVSIPAINGNINFTASGNANILVVTGTGINVTGSIIPSANDVYDLGQANARWRNGYFGGNTIYLDTASISVNANGFVVISNEVGGTFTVQGNDQADTTSIVSGTSNVKVYSSGNVATTVSGVANVLVVTTDGANLTGNLTATGVKTDNLYYGNGNPWDINNPGGNNTQVQFNSNGAFGASPNFTFNNSTSTVQVDGNLVANTMQIGSGIYAWSKSFIHLATTISNADQLLYSVAAANISGVEFHIIATDNTLGARQSTKISSVVYDGQIQNNEYAGLYINDGIGSFAVQYNPGNLVTPPAVELRVTPDNNSQIAYKMLITLFAS